MRVETVLNNVKYANIGDVTMHFTDGSSVTKTISSIGLTVFATEGRTLGYTEALKQTFDSLSGPTNFTYPDGSKGLAYTEFTRVNGTEDSPLMKMQLNFL